MWLSRVHSSLSGPGLHTAPYNDAPAWHFDEITQRHPLDPDPNTGFSALLTLVLYPRLAKRSGRLGGRGAPGSARAAVLNALAALEPAELLPLLELLLTPISTAFTRPVTAAAEPACIEHNNKEKVFETQAAAAAAAAGSIYEPVLQLPSLQATLDNAASMRLIPEAWWTRAMLTADLQWWLAATPPRRLSQQPLRRRQGFLNAFEDILTHLGHRIVPSLPCLLALTLSQLQLACAPLQDGGGGGANVKDGSGAGGDAAREEGRALRSQCLRLLAQVWERFPDAHDYNPLWPAFFAAVTPLMPRLAAESAASTPPPLLAAAAALAAAPGLAPVLGNAPSSGSSSNSSSSSNGGGGAEPSGAGGVTPKGASLPSLPALSLPHHHHQGTGSCTKAPAAAHALLPAGHIPAWAANGSGSELLAACVGVLGVPSCSGASRAAVLSLVESCLLLPPPLLKCVLLPWTGRLLACLRVSVEATLVQAAAGANGGKRVRMHVHCLMMMTIMMCVCVRVCVHVCVHVCVCVCVCVHMCV
jgi:Down-regulated in metastasis